MKNDKGKKTISSDDNPLGELPYKDRQGMFSMMVVLLGFTFFTSTMFAGGQIGPNFAFWPDMIIVICIGNLLLGIYVSLLSVVAQKTGYTSVVLSRYSFGNKGSKLVDFLLGFTQIGWYAWGTATISLLFVKMLGLSDSWLIPLMVVFGFGFGWTSFIGYKGISMLSKVAVPAMAILIFWSFAISFDDIGGFSGLGRVPEKAMPFTLALTLVFGTFVSGGTQSTNWTRFAKTPKIAVVSSMVAFFIGNGLMIFAGALGGYVYQQADIIEVLLIQGLTISALIMLFLNVWTTQDNSIYSASIAGCNFFRTKRRRLINFIACGISTLLAIAGMYNWLVPYLSIMGTVIPPIGGIIMSDFYVKNKRHYPKLSEIDLKDYNCSGLITYFVAAIVAYFSPGVAPINGIVVAFVLYPIVDKILVSMNKSQEHSIITGNVQDSKAI
ncbi:MAG: cytosine permease [Desulfotignum sp.]|nr:cytosine permease [Desulfotignum sp.]